MLKTKFAAAATLAGLLSAGMATGASAHSPSDDDQPRDWEQVQTFRVELDELNDSGATGRAKLLLRGNQLTITIKARGLAPNLVHAQHIHGKGMSECPQASAAGGDGVLSMSTV